MQDELVDELDRWAGAGRTLDLWWRDDDAARLTPALHRLTADPGLRMKLGAAGRERYLERYTVDHWVDAMIRVVRSVADQ